MAAFQERLVERVRAVGSPTCVGLDPHLDRLPGSLVQGREPEALAAAVEGFFLGVIEVIADRTAAVKPQVAFFEQLGAPGVAVLQRVCRAAREAGLLVVLDAKRGDIGSTARAYARATLDDAGPIGADAVTLSPYLGPESMDPFLAHLPDGKGLFVLVRTSNPGAGVWQASAADAIAPRVAAWIAGQNDAGQGPSGFGPVGAVVGATVPEEAGTWRERMPRAWFLVPGFGAQGATARDIVHHARGDGMGALITSSRGVLFPPEGTEGRGWKDAVAARCEDLVRDVAGVLPISA